MAEQRGKVRWHLTMSLDGFMAGKDGSMDWMAGLTTDPGLVDEAVATTGAVLGGRRGWDQSVALVGADEAAGLVYGGAWSGKVFVLTHHPEDVVRGPGVTFLSCDVGEAVEIALAAADGKDLEILSADIARQCVLRGLIEDFYVHLAPVMLGEGVRLFDAPGIEPVRWHRVGVDDPLRAVDLRYRPAG
jgi:dihydrofolate reductase